MKGPGFATGPLSVPGKRTLYSPRMTASPASPVLGGLMRMPPPSPVFGGSMTGTMGAVYGPGVGTVAARGQSTVTDVVVDTSPAEMFFAVAVMVAVPLPVAGALNVTCTLPLRVDTF